MTSSFIQWLRGGSSVTPTLSQSLDDMAYQGGRSRLASESKICVRGGTLGIQTARPCEEGPRHAKLTEEARSSLSNNDDDHSYPKPFGVIGMVDRDSLALALLMAGKTGPVSLRSLGAPSHCRVSFRRGPDRSGSHRRVTPSVSFGSVPSGGSSIGSVRRLQQQQQQQLRSSEGLSSLAGSSPAGILASRSCVRRSEKSEKILTRIATMQKQQDVNQSCGNDETFSPIQVFQALPDVPQVPQMPLLVETLCSIEEDNLAPSEKQQQQQGANGSPLR